MVVNVDFSLRFCLLLIRKIGRASDFAKIGARWAKIEDVEARFLTAIPSTLDLNLHQVSAAQCYECGDALALSSGFGVVR